jgi:hypothetical protein
MCDLMRAEAKNTLEIPPPEIRNKQTDKTPRVNEAVEFDCLFFLNR